MNDRIGFSNDDRQVHAERDRFAMQPTAFT
jgi:hypothetical protein